MLVTGFRVFASLALAATLTACATGVETRKEKADKEARRLVSAMTLDEKLAIIQGEDSSADLVERLGLPRINMAGSSLGLTMNSSFREKGLEKATAFPSTVLLAATWNPRVAYAYSKAIAEEFRARNMHVILGPAINVYRSPLCGRNFEYMGEDPFLISKMVVGYVKGAQDEKVLVTVKHFVANNSENKRQNSNSVVSERALREIYFPGFKAAVEEGKASGIMSSYNLLNGKYCGEDKWLLTDVLRNEWGFDGMVVSDWTSIWNPEPALKSGMDIEMPGTPPSIFNPDTVKKLIKEGKVSESDIDKMVRHILKPCLEYGVLEKGWADPSLNKISEHDEIALRTNREGITLLKNDGALLPLEPARTKKIVVIGPAAVKTPTTAGGSGAVRPEKDLYVNILTGMRNIYGDKIEYLDSFDKSKVAKADAVVVCVGFSVNLKLRDWTKKLTPEEEKEFQKIKPPDIEDEGRDREKRFFNLPGKQEALILECAAANPNTAVLISSGGGIGMSRWLDKVKSVVWMYYGGQNGGQAVADIVSGKVNPSGKLPFNMDKRLEDNAAYHDFNLSWTDKRPKKKAGCRTYQDVSYSEGIFIGYRHYDKAGLEPLFPFGHGLSYTTFEYSDLEINASPGLCIVSFTLKNTGKRPGAEVAQIYVGDVVCSVPRPLKELKGFDKVFLAPGASLRVAIGLPSSAFAFWSPVKKRWTIEPGEFKIYVGASSRDIRLTGTVELSSDWEPKSAIPYFPERAEKPPTR